MDRQLIEEFEACGPRLRHAVAGLSPEDLTARPGPGDWSILELVIHLTDSDCIAIDRMNLVGSNPVFGLNALGGAVAVQMKNGFTYHGTEVDALGGSFAKYQGELQSGVQVGDVAAYAALTALDGRGAIAIGRVLASIAAHPTQIPTLLALASDATTARRALFARVGAVASVFIKKGPHGGHQESMEIH